MNNSEAGNSKLKSTNNAARYQISVSAVDQCNRIQFPLNTRFSDPCHARTILGIGCVYGRSTMHEYLPNDAKQNFVMADHLWRLNCTEHRCLYALYAFERLFNASCCFGNCQISADVTGTDPDTKKPSSTAGSFQSYSSKCLVKLVFNVADGCVDQFVRGCRC